METNRTILFADVRDSTSITERLGDTQSRQLIGTLMEELSAITVEHGGTVIKTIGDEIMAAFSTPAAAVRAAAQMQRHLVARPAGGEIRPQVGIGLNAGPVVIEDGDMFGDVVNVAARLVGNAVAGQILTTGSTVGEIDDLDVVSRSLGDHLLKGREDNVELCEILWRGETAQLTTLAPKLFETPLAVLELRLGSEGVSLSTDQPGLISVGRGSENDLIVPTNSASRKHAKVTSRSGRFYLVDHSTNGTFVRPEGGDEIVVHRDEILVTGSGHIRLGDTFAEDGVLEVEYRTSGGA